MKGHHVLFSRRLWNNVSIEAKELRRIPQLIPKIDRDAHVELHRRVPIVPLPDNIMLQQIAYRYKPEETHLASIERLMFVIAEVAGHPRMTNIEQRLGAVTIYALEEQRPYLIEGGADAT